jgi:hypothetical protein
MHEHMHATLARHECSHMHVWVREDRAEKLVLTRLRAVAGMH